MNPYDIIKDKSPLNKYEKILGIEDAHIFESVLKGNKAVDTALGMIVSSVSGAVNPGGILGWMNLCAIKNDSSSFLTNQISRLKITPDKIYQEIGLNMLLFACMGHNMETWINHNKRMSDVGRLAIGLFSSNKMREWEESLVARLIECVRWIYSSTMLLLIHYIILCESQNSIYDKVKLREIASDLVTLYCSCDSAMECFIVDYKDFVSSQYNYLHDILLANEESYTPYVGGLSLTKNDIEIIKRYCSGDNRKHILKDIEESTIK